MAGTSTLRAVALLFIGAVFVMPATIYGATHVSKQPFGRMPDGTVVDVFTLTNGPIEARIITYGGAVQSLKVPDRHGVPADVVLGYDTLEGYLSASNPYFGALLGRYANRIAKGRFQIGDKTYSVPVNNGPNALHGGLRGFDKRVWKARKIPNGVELTYVSPDGEEGFPGNVTATVRYTLVAKSLAIDYRATTDQPTVINLSNHTYFALAGQGTGDILGHFLTLAASRFTPVDATLISTGEMRSVAGTPFDFRTAHRIGERIDMDDEQLKHGGGYDHNWVLDAADGKLAEAAELYEPTSGRLVEVLTTEPGLQFYTGNFLDGTITGRAGRVYKHRYGLSLETQHFPDSPNHPTFPSTRLEPGHEYHSTTVYRFSAR